VTKACFSDAESITLWKDTLHKAAQKLYYFVGGHKLEHVERTGLALVDDWSLRGGCGLTHVVDLRCEVSRQVSGRVVCLTNVSSSRPTLDTARLATALPGPESPDYKGHWRICFNFLFLRVLFLVTCARLS